MIIKVTVLPEDVSPGRYFVRIQKCPPAAVVPEPPAKPTAPPMPPPAPAAPVVQQRVHTHPSNCQEFQHASGQKPSRAKPAPKQSKKQLAKLMPLGIELIVAVDNRNRYSLVVTSSGSVAFPAGSAVRFKSVEQLVKFINRADLVLSASVPSLRSAINNAY